MILTKKQEEALKIAIERYRTKKKYTVISGFAGTGKAQPIETIIPTLNGKKKIGELNIGDYVFDRLGKPTKVLGIYPQGKRKKYEITLADGRKTICADDHLWSYYTSRGNLNTKTTQEMLNSGLKNSSGFKYKIPNNQAVEYPEQEFIIDPYMMGVFLGDGCCKERYLTLSSETDEIPKIIGEIIGATPYKSSINNYRWTFEWVERTETIKWCNSNRIEERKKTKTIDYFQLYEKYLLCYAQEKDIPPEYKIGSIQQRLELIQGLLDTEGSIGQHDQNRFNVKFTSTSIKLVQSLQEILYSLGYSSTITEDNRNEKYTNEICYGLNINIPNEEKYKLFRLKRKKDIAEKAKEFHKHKDYNKISIIDIQPLQEETDMICIYVDNNEHLYLTNDYIVTHNTTLIHFIIAALNIDLSDVCYCAFTGKATQVLKDKGCENVRTLHKLLYKSYKKKNGTYAHIKRTELDHDYKLIVVDEVSMVPLDLWILLLQHKVHVIALGDPFQIPSIGKNTTILSKPHIFLDEIVRQARESEIIRLSQGIRERKMMPTRFNGKQVKIMQKEELNMGMLTWADQILASKNVTRRRVNDQYRRYIYKDEYTALPKENDKMICLTNYWDLYEEPLINGALGNIGQITYTSNPYVRAIAKTDFITNNFTFSQAKIDCELFLSGKMTSDTNFKIPKKFTPLEFDYGNVITIHKSQGSQYNKILLLEEQLRNVDHDRLIYTAVTRAIEKIVIIRDYEI